MAEDKDSLVSEQSLRYLPHLVAASFFMLLLDATILNTALPSIAHSFQCDPLSLHAVVVSYALTVAVLIPASGWISDKWGTRKTFSASILLFILGSLLCACSPSVLFLTISRIIQGAGAAFLMPVGRLTLLRSYPRAEFVKVLSYVAIPGLLGPLMGPTLGGTLSQYASWQWIFLINLPIGLVGMWVAHKHMPNLYAVEKTKFDIRGFLLFSLSLVFISLSLDDYKSGGAMLPLIYLLVGGGLMVAYGIHAHFKKNPIFSGQMFKTLAFKIGLIGNILSRLGGSAMPYLMPLFFQVVLGYSAFKSGLSLLPLGACAILVKFVTTPILQKLGYKRVLVMNTIMIGILISCFSLISKETPGWMLLILLACLGWCNSLQFTSMNTLTLVDLPDKYASSGNTLLAVVMQLCMSLAVGGASLLLGVYGAGISQKTVVLDKTEFAFHATFITMGILTLISSLIFTHAPNVKIKNVKRKR